MDEVDRAQVVSEKYLNGALAANIAVRVGLSRFFCDECGEGIPEARRKAVPGCTRCVDCQEDFEKEELRASL